MNTGRTPVFACNMQALTPEERPQHISTIRDVFGSVHAVHDLEDGYTFHLPDDTSLLKKAGEFIARERLCCPFFTFTLTVDPERAEVLLSLSGPEGIKPFIQAEVGSYMAGNIWSEP